MEVTVEVAMKLWSDVYGAVKWARDCFGTLMYKDAYSNEAVIMIWPEDGKKYDMSWNVDHIRPKSDFDNQNDADFWNNYEPMHRLNNQEKSDNYPDFKVREKSYQVVRCTGFYGYGIKISNDNRIDWKAKYNKHY